MEKKTGIIISIIAVLLGVISIIVLKSMETQPEPKKEYTTTLNINGADIKMGMTEEELYAFFPEETFTSWATKEYGVIDEDAGILALFNNDRNDNQVLGKMADVSYLFYWDDKGVTDLREVCIEFKEDIVSETIVAELESLYGEYEKSWWGDAGILRESYRWDIEDGSSVMYQASMGGEVKMLYMIRTEDINEYRQCDTLEEAKERKKQY